VKVTCAGTQRAFLFSFVCGFVCGNEVTCHVKPE
jgi:hypothetical protein